MSDYREYLEEQLKDPEFKEEYDQMGAQYEFARQVIAARIAAGMSQAELAKKVGTTQANISKIEHADMNPSFAFAQRIANGLGKRLSFSMV